MLNRLAVLEPLGPAGGDQLAAALVAHRANITRRAVVRIDADPSAALRADGQSPRTLAESLRVPSQSGAEPASDPMAPGGPALIVPGLELESVFGQLGALAVETGHVFSVAHHLRRRLDTLAAGRESVLHLGPGMGALVSALASTSTAVVLVAPVEAFQRHFKVVARWLDRLALLRPDGRELTAIISFGPPSSPDIPAYSYFAALRTEVAGLLAERSWSIGDSNGGPSRPDQEVKWMVAGAYVRPALRARLIWKLIDEA